MEAKKSIISSEKDKNKNISNTQVIIQDKSKNSLSPISNKATDNIQSNDNSNSLNILSFINDMSFENLNDYYDIETSLFLKRIEKLNLKFYWTSECVLNQQDIKYPYNKLFLILFKQLSLYIEEIARLNKQLKQKIKNEKYFQIKIANLKQKEKEYILNKQMLKNLQRDNKLLEKKNEMNKNEIEKLNKKLSNNKTNITINNLNNTTTNEMYMNKKNKLFIGSPKATNTSLIYDSLITHKSPLNSKNNKLSNLDYSRNDNYNKKVFNSIDNAFVNKNGKTNNDEMINQGIIQCDEEIGNLELIEDILKEFKNKVIYNNKNKNKSSNNNIININNYNTPGKIKKEKNNKKIKFNI